MNCHPFEAIDGQSSPGTMAFHKIQIEHAQPCVSCHIEHQGVLAPITRGVPDNPHGELIFRVSNANACSDCHMMETRKDMTHFAVIHNKRVQHLLAQGEGAHRSGYFARCLNCHIGGRIESEGNDD